MLKETTVVIEYESKPNRFTDSIPTLHEALCLAIHEGDKDALDILSAVVTDITEKD